MSRVGMGALVGWRVLHITLRWIFLELGWREGNRETGESPGQATMGDRTQPWKVGSQGVLHTSTHPTCGHAARRGVVLGVHCSITPLKEQSWIQPTVVLLRVGRNLLLCGLLFTELCRSKSSYHHEEASLTSSSSSSQFQLIPLRNFPWENSEAVAIMSSRLVVCRQLGLVCKTERENRLCLKYLQLFL